MAEDYYSDGGGEPNAPEAKESAGDKPTALLPKSFFPDGDPQPGKICKVRVVKAYDDQVSVSYEHSEEPEEEAVEAAPVETMSDGGAADYMA